MLKGKAIIEMFDAKTGEKVYHQEHNNIVTNAYKKLINPNFISDLGFGGSSVFNIGSISPLAEKIFGGILLFSEQTEANADNFMIKKIDYANFVGCAGSSWGGDSIYRGSYNASESGKQSDNTYKIVFDWASNAGNGKISRVCLCPRYLGNAGLIKDLNDTTNTSLLVDYGQDFASSGALMYKGGYGVHHFHRHNTANYGYFLYSKSTNTNVYVRHSGKKYYFTEITKTNRIGLTEKFETIAPSSKNLEEMNFYTISDTVEVDYSEESAIQDSKYLEYYQGYIYFVTHTVSSGNITFKVFKINASDYTKVESKEYNFTIADLPSSTIYPHFINNKIYFTNTYDYLYIYNLEDGTFKSIQILDNLSITYEAIKFYDTVALIRRNAHDQVAPIFILDSNDNLCRNSLYYNDSNTNYSSINKLNTNNDCLNYPIANETNLYYHSSIGTVEYENQVVMPFVSTINNVDVFYKNNSNTMKITYILEEV